MKKPNKTNRSKLSNRSTLLAGKVDGRKAPARRIRDLHNDLVEKVTGGKRIITVSEEGLIRQLSALLCHQELEAAKLADGVSEFDARLFTSTANTCNRLLAALDLMPDDDEDLDNDPDLSGINALEVYCKRKDKELEARKPKRRVDKRRERLGR